MKNDGLGVQILIKKKLLQSIHCGRTAREIGFQCSNYSTFSLFLTTFTSVSYKLNCFLMGVASAAILSQDGRPVAFVKDII